MLINPVRNCGDGRIRTAVQTEHPKAFYTFSLHLFVGRILPAGGPYTPYLLKSYCKAGDSLQPALRKRYPLCKNPEGGNSCGILVTPGLARSD